MTSDDSTSDAALLSEASVLFNESKLPFLLKSDSIPMAPMNMNRTDHVRNELPSQALLASQNEDTREDTRSSENFEQSCSMCKSTHRTYCCPSITNAVDRQVKLMALARRRPFASAGSSTTSLSTPTQGQPFPPLKKLSEACATLEAAGSTASDKDEFLDRVVHHLMENEQLLDLDVLGENAPSCSRAV